MAACATLEIQLLDRPNAPYSFAGTSGDAVARELPRTRGELARAIMQELRGTIRTLVVCPTADVFKIERERVFGEYFLLGKTLSKVILTGADVMIHQALVQAGLNTIEALVRERCDGVFGADVTGEILFSLGTMRRTFRIFAEIVAQRFEVPENRLKEDREHAKAFRASLSWSGLHMDCIGLALRDPHVRVAPDVLHELLAGLRFAVEAYAHVREGYAIRHPRPLNDPAGRIQWDDEDRFLAKWSTDNMIQGQGFNE